MLSSQLNGGKISDFVPIGQDGQPIYLNAEAFRSALNINPQIGPEQVKYLAIPKVSADGLTIDWYIPFPPIAKNGGDYQIVAWNAATPEEQGIARQKLHTFERNLERLGADLSRRGGDAKNMLFARYLTGQSTVEHLPAIHFPGPEYIFIVDGIPVITFWGFTGKDTSLNQSPFASLTSRSAFGPTGAGAAPAAGAVGVGALGAAALPPNEDNSQKSSGHRCFLAGHTCALPLWLRFVLGAILLGLLLWWLLPYLLGLFRPSASIFDSSSNLPVQEQVQESAPEAPAEPSVAEPAAEPAVVAAAEPLPAETPAEPGSTDQTTLDLNLNGNGEVIGIEPIPVSTSHTEPGLNLNPDGSAAPSDNLNQIAPGVSLAGGEPVASGSEELPSPEPAGNGQMSVPPELNLPPESQDQMSAPAAPVEPGVPGTPEAGMPGAPEGGMPGGSMPGEPGGSMPGNSVPLTPADPDMSAIQSNLTPEQQAALEAARQAEEMAVNNNGGTGAGNAQAALPEPANSLKFSQEKLASSGAAVMNGSWKTQSGLMDSTNGRPLNLSYSFNQGKGQVTVVRPDGVKCVAPASSAVSGGGVAISSDGRAVCPDNTSYQLPQIKCQPQQDGRVLCEGAYGSKSFPIKFFAQ